MGLRGGLRDEDTTAVGEEDKYTAAATTQNIELRSAATPLVLIWVVVSMSCVLSYASCLLVCFSSVSCHKDFGTKLAPFHIREKRPTTLAWNII